MALFGSGSSTALWRAPRDLPAYGGRPIWVSAWTRAASTASTGGLASFGTTLGGVQSAGPYLTSTSASAWDENDAGTSAFDTLGSGVAANVWQHWLAYYPSTASRALYLNGVQVGSNTSALAGTTQTFNAMIVGTVRTTVLSTARAVGEVTFGNGLLSPDQINGLARGRSPLVVTPNQILGYFPLRGDLADLGPVRAGLQPVGGVISRWTEHPPVDLPPRRRLILPSSLVGPPPTLRKPFIFFIR